MPSDLKVTSIILASMSNCHLSLTKKSSQAHWPPPELSSAEASLLIRSLTAQLARAGWREHTAAADTPLAVSSISG